MTSNRIPANPENRAPSEKPPDEKIRIKEVTRPAIAAGRT